MKIYCPKCKWEPGPSDRWMCEASCRHVWNTFQTRGVCPRCQQKWAVTQCLSCQQRSPHEDWYHDEDDGEISAESLRPFIEFLTEEIEIEPEL